MTLNSPTVPEKGRLPESRHQRVTPRRGHNDQSGAGQDCSHYASALESLPIPSNRYRIPTRPGGCLRSSVQKKDRDWFFPI